MLKEINLEKAKIGSKSRELAMTSRQNALTFKNREAVLNNELKQAKTSIEQTQANADRAKKAMTDMQLIMQQQKETLNATSSQEIQSRVKAVQSQKQVEMLTKEIARMNAKKNQPGAAAATPGGAQPRGTAEMQKQIDTANKALLAKKQDFEKLRKQIAEKEAKETEFKRTIVKLQGELNLAKAAPPAKKKTA